MTPIKSAFAGSDARRPTRLSVGLALACGLAVGTLISAPLLVITLSSATDPARQRLADTLELAPFAAQLWFFALLIAGAPAWFLLHRLKARGCLSAVLLGAGLAALFLTAICALASSFRPDQAIAFFELFPIVPVLTPVGAVVGGVIWLVAYRPVRLSAAA